MANTMPNTGRELGWNDTIEHDSEYTLLPEGDYDFEVVNLERARHGGSAKLPACNKAVLTLRLTDGLHTGSVTHNLFLHSSCEWALCAFFTAIGQRKSGEVLKMDWGKVVGAKGRCKVAIHAFTSNRTGEEIQTNRVAKFYEPQFTPTDEPTPWDGSNF